MTAKAYPQLTVADLMTPSPETASPGSALADVQSQMELSSIRHLPVVDSGGHVLGILSQRDVLRALSRHDPTLPVEEIMTADTLFVNPDTRLCEASALLLDRKIGALPVVDRDNTLVGIITETDFVRVAHEVCGGLMLADAD